MNDPGTTPVRRASWSSGFGPETLAAILSVLLIGLILLVVGPLRPTDSGAAASPTESARPAAGATATAAPGASQPPVAWLASAQALLALDRRLAVQRDELATTIANKKAPTTDIVAQLRALNATLVSVAAPIKSIAEAGAPADLVADLDVAHQAITDAVSSTLRASVQNAAAYRSGAAAVIKSIDPLQARDARLSASIGIPLPSPTARPSAS